MHIYYIYSGTPNEMFPKSFGLIQKEPIKKAFVQGKQNLNGDWGNLLPVTFKWISQIWYHCVQCTGWGFLSVWGMTIHTRQHCAARCYAGAKQEHAVHQEMPLVPFFSFFHSFRVKMLSSSNKNVLKQFLCSSLHQQPLVTTCRSFSVFFRTASRSPFSLSYFLLLYL